MDAKSKAAGLIRLRKDRNIRFIERQQEAMEKASGPDLRIAIQLLQPLAPP